MALGVTGVPPMSIGYERLDFSRQEQLPNANSGNLRKEDYNSYLLT